MIVVLTAFNFLSHGTQAVLACVTHSGMPTQ